MFSTAINAQQRQKHDHICRDAALLNKYPDGAALTEEEKKRVTMTAKECPAVQMQMPGCSTVE
jgi:hypothetical protein